MKQGIIKNQGFSHPIGGKAVRGSNYTLTGLSLDFHPIILFEDHSGEGYFYVQARSSKLERDQEWFWKPKFPTEITFKVHSEITQYLKHQSYLDLANIFHISKDDFKLAFPKAQVVFLDQIYSKKDVTLILNKLLTFNHRKPPYFKISEVSWQDNKTNLTCFYLSNDLSNDFATSLNQNEAQAFLKDAAQVDNNTWIASAMLNEINLALQSLVSFYQAKYPDLKLKPTKQYKR